MALHTSSTLISMKSSLSENFNVSSLNSIPTEIQQTILNFMKQPQWWYLQKTFKYNNKINFVCLDPSEKLIAIASERHTPLSPGNACILDIQTGKKIFSFEHKRPVTSVCFDHSGKLLATTSKDTKARIFDLQTNKKISSFKHNYSVFLICFDHSRKLFATYSGDWITRIFDIKKNKEISSFKKEISPFQYDHLITNMYFDLSGKLITTTSRDKNIHIFNIKTDERSPFLEYHHLINGIGFDLSEKLIAIISNNKKVHVFDIQTKEKKFSFTYDEYNNIKLAVAEKLFAITSDRDNKKIHIFTRYDNYTIKQLILKNALLTWLLIEKPDKKIDSLEKLIKNIASKFEIPYDELFKIYATFPENMQKALLNTMLYKIKKHGKM